METRITTARDNAITEAVAITEEMYQRYIDYLDVSPKTRETYTRAVRQFMKWIKANGISQPTRADILLYRDELKQNHAPATVQSYITATRLFFQWVELETGYKNPCEHIKGATISKEHKRDALTASQVKSIVSEMETETPQGRRDYAIFVLMISCGLRTIEIVRADIGDLRPLGNDTILYIQGKGREEKADFVKVPAKVEQAIRASIADRDNKDDSQPLFTSLSNNSKGQRMTTRSISGIVKNAMRKAGYDSKRLSAHSTRHTAVTLALLGGQSLDEVRQFARHRDISTTTIYAHNIDRMNNNCSNTVANAIF